MSKLNPDHLAVIWHPLCVLHHIPSHPESPLRVDGIMTALRNTFDPEVFREANVGTDDVIKLFHTTKHVKYMRDVFMRAGGVWDELSEAYSPSVANKVARVSIDGDTNAMSGTGGAAYRAVGAAVDAVDLLFGNDASPVKTAFCCVRPPGHHAERGLAGGFCFFNNAAIAARYAQHKYGVKKVAVLDFDVHHGNGTEEGFYEDETLFYGSTHEKDNYPGTGVDPSPFVGSQAKRAVDRRIVNRTLDPRNGKSRYAAGDDEYSVRDQFRTKWTQVIKEMERFKPDFVVFSAGFDAHDADPLACCDLLEVDFVWATEIVLDACYRLNPTNPVKCISLLEGGYNVPALSNSALVHVLALMAGSPQAKAAAKAARLAETGPVTVEIKMLSTKKFGVFEAITANTTSSTTSTAAGGGMVDTPVKLTSIKAETSFASDLQAQARQLADECAKTHHEALLHIQQQQKQQQQDEATSEVSVDVAIVVTEDTTSAGTAGDPLGDMDDVALATAVLEALDFESS